MKKIRTLLVAFVLVFGLFFITGCGKEDNTNKNDEPKTVASMLCKEFETEIKNEKDIEKVAQKLAANEIIVPQVQTFEIAKDDYLAGFKEEIKGFDKAVGMAPMIGTIPFVAYVFEVENSEEFVKTLEENHQLNWNICTQADEMKTTVVDNYVFFVMSPTSFEE